MGEQIVIGLIVAGAFAYAAKRLLLDPLRRRRAGGCGGGCGCSHAGAATAPAPTPAPAPLRRLPSGGRGGAG